MVLLPLAWFALGASYVAGWLLPEPAYGPALSLRPLLALALGPLLVLATLAGEARIPPAGQRARLALALGTFHAVAFDAWMQAFWPALDFARTVFSDPWMRLALWILAVGAAGLALGASDVARSGAGAWRVLGRAALAGGALALATVFVVGVRAGDLGGAFAILPLASLFAVPVGAVAGLAFGGLDLALAWLVRNAPRTPRNA